ncbi:MAG TPA: S41 family peptidase [Ignavibacteriaceae bacterium]|nr:S41 family peptidase [Ignavibacteriaceae bacterium]
MSRLFKNLIFILIFGSIGIFAQDNSPFVRYPALNSVGSKIAFSFQGDIWTVPAGGGTATRLTIHEAYDGTPKWSPDDNLIAFSSDRYSNNDIFTIPSNGGFAKRLTYRSSGDNLSDWTTSGDLLFETKRDYRQIEWDNELYKVSPDGGTPVRILDALGYMPTMSPDNRFIAFVKGSCRLEREDYKGPANKDLWIYDTKTKGYSRITSYEGQDFYPDWSDSRTIYFLSARSGKYNVFKMSIDDNGKPIGSPTQVSKFTDDGVRYFDVSRNGKSIAMERQTDIYFMNLDNGSPVKVNINVSDDYRFDPVVYKNYSNRADEYAVSPNGKYSALVIRGDVFVTENDKEKSLTVDVTNNPYRDMNINWLCDTSIVFSSDREGQFDLYLVRSSDKNEKNLFKSLKHETIRLTNTPEDESDPVISPDGKKIAYVRGNGEFIVADINADGKMSNSKTLLNGWATPDGVTWSPDSRWLAYSMPDLDFNDEIYIQPADNSQKPVNISMHPKGDYSPVWSMDGKKLGFISSRNNGDNDVWFVWLNKKDWEKTKQDWDEFDDSDKKTDKKDKDSSGVKPIEIDFDKIYDRLVQVTGLPGNESDVAISKDGETFYFVANRNSNQSYDADQDLYSINWDGKKLTQLTKGNTRPYAVSLQNDGKYLFMLKPGGKLSRLDIKSSKEESLPFAAQMKIDFPVERKQIFEEAWRTLNNGFYDPDFHGKDWNVLKKKYEPWAIIASTEKDFRDIFNYMLGELNSSHQGMYGSDRSETERETTGLLGIEVGPVKDGVLIEHVIPNTPADKTESKLNEGDVINSIDGEPVTENSNFYSFFVNKNNRRVLLNVKDKNGNEREVVIRPTSSISSDLYEEWVEEHRKLTDKYSNGKLGYIHIQGMNWPSFERFERELTATGLGKEGIVIDVRFNGGGWTTDYLMTVLTYRQHAYTIPRGAADNLKKEQTNFTGYYPLGERLPFAAWTKPSIAMCNSSSYSNAEIFSHAYKTLNIGTLVGEPTFGAVISTGGRGLIDGSFVRLPFRGWYVKATEKNMEWGPAIPDIVVEESPNARAMNKDEQLKAAVDELMNEINSK